LLYYSKTENKKVPEQTNTAPAIPGWGFFIATILPPRPPPNFPLRTGIGPDLSADLSKSD